MRNEKLELIKQYINELKTIRFEINESARNGFISSIPYLCTLNNGRVIPREKIFKNGGDGSAVVIVPYINETNEFLVVVEPRVFTEIGVSISFPAGYIDPGETPIIAAERELREETGYVSKQLIQLDSYYQDEGVSGAFNHSFLALNCIKKFNQDLDENEIIKYITLTYEELIELEKEGIISGGNTKLALLRVKDYMNRRN